MDHEDYSSVALYLDVVKESVNNAIATPYAITASSYTEYIPEYNDFKFKGLTVSPLFFINVTKSRNIVTNAKKQLIQTTNDTTKSP